MTESYSIVRHGVDFSGADGGGSGIRLATRVPDEPVRRIDRLDRRGLRDRIMASCADGERHLWLIDAPFGIPLRTLRSCGVEESWSASVDWLASFGSPRDWRRAVRTVDRKEPKREADVVASTPLASMNLRVFKQTWTAMVELLQPLVEAGVRVDPMAGPLDARVVIGEGCPATVLKRRGDSAKGYKGAGQPPRDRREAILRQGIECWGLDATEAVFDRCHDDEGGDDLDALLLTLDPWHGPPTAAAMVEGWVW